MPALTDPDTLIVLTTSPTGLGHIRVINALIDGLAAGSARETIGVADVNAAKIHSLGSRVPLLLKITEFIQNNETPESIVTKVYQWFFSIRTRSLWHELEKVKAKYPNKKRWVIVSTHFALAYPITAVKEKFAKANNIEVKNVLVVTDDSPQRIWAVDKTDIIFVPSEKTGERLRQLLPENSQTHIETISFPVSPRLATKLSEDELLLRENQLDPKRKEDLHISVPVSGAAVQLPYLEVLIKTLAPGKFIFTVIGQMTPFTESFFESMHGSAHVQLSAGSTARETVSLYSSAFFQGLSPSVEITKPSEQAFKAILKPSERGGVLIFLTDPIGRQEKDNLDFLARHSLIPEHEEQEALEQFLLTDQASVEAKNNLFYKASHWRVLRLPPDPRIAAIFIKRAKETGLLYTMLSYIPETKKDLTSDGVAQIWNKIGQMLQ